MKGVRHSIEIERLIAFEAGNIEPAAEIQLGNRRSDRIGDLARAGDDRPMRFDQRFGVEALRAQEHVQPAPVGIGLDQALNQRWHPLSVDSKWAWAGAHRHSPALDRQRWIDANGELGLDAKPLRRLDRSARLVLAFDADRRPGSDPGFELVVALARTGKGHRDAGKLGAFQMLELPARHDPESVDVPAEKSEQAPPKGLH